MEPLKTKRPTFTRGPSQEFAALKKRLEASHEDSARWHLQAALETHGTDLDDYARELLEAVKHIDNARKMLREEKTP